MQLAEEPITVGKTGVRLAQSAETTGIIRISPEKHEIHRLAGKMSVARVCGIQKALSRPELANTLQEYHSHTPTIFVYAWPDGKKRRCFGERAIVKTITNIAPWHATIN